MAVRLAQLPDCCNPCILAAGGERNRLHLASVLRQTGNVLLLDEPTNDLDVDTLRCLESALLNFAGSPDCLVPCSLAVDNHK